MVDKMSETSETPIISVIIPFHNTENYILFSYVFGGLMFS